MVFDASTCMLFANFPQASILLSSKGRHVTLTPSELLDLQSSQLISELVVEDREIRVISPIVLPSGLHFGWLMFYRPVAENLTAKERATLRVLQRDIANNLLLTKQIFEDAKAQELQTAISEHNEDWIFVKDTQYRIVYANQAFLEFYPEDMRDRVVGYTTVEEYEKEEADAFLKQDRIAFEQGISTMTAILNMPDGRQRIVETVKRRFEDAKGKSYILCVCRDVTAKEKLISELKKANEELGYFTSVASHDLKSPLNAIRRLLGWIEEDCSALLPEEHLENMQLVINRADRMHALLDDLLAYAKIGREEASVGDLSLSKMYTDIAQLLDLPDNFTVNVPNTTLHVPTVPFKTVMLNLISNAVKHNDKEHGIVDIVVTETRHFYIIEVTDNGPGVEAIYFERIFQLFQTLKSRDETEGSGIGLSVVMKYVSRHGGKVEVSSDGILGTTFTVTWPKAAR
ncbi:MAG: ATP-binding protein [Congregibacter sp.]